MGAVFVDFKTLYRQRHHIEQYGAIFYVQGYEYLIGDIDISSLQDGVPYVIAGTVQINHDGGSAVSGASFTCLMSDNEGNAITNFPIVNINRGETDTIPMNGIFTKTPSVNKLNFYMRAEWSGASVTANMAVNFFMFN